MTLHPTLFEADWPLLRAIAQHRPPDDATSAPVGGAAPDANAPDAPTAAQPERALVASDAR